MLLSLLSDSERVKEDVARFVEFTARVPNISRNVRRQSCRVKI